MDEEGEKKKFPQLIKVLTGQRLQMEHFKMIDCNLMVPGCSQQQWFPNLAA